MEIEQIVKSLVFIRPNAQWVISGDDINSLEWIDTEQTKPTNEEIKKGWLKYEEFISTQAKAKEIQRQAIADRLGLTADELQVLLG
jgi:hypothetical protein